MQVRQRRPFEVGRELLEIVVGLAGKAGDDVRADRGVRQARADVVDERGVVLDGVRAAASGRSMRFDACCSGR